MKRKDLKVGSEYYVNPSGDWQDGEDGYESGRVTIVDTKPVWASGSGAQSPYDSKPPVQVVMEGDESKPWQRREASALVLVDFEPRNRREPGQLLPARRAVVKLATIRGPWKMCLAERANRAERKERHQEAERARKAAERKTFTDAHDYLASRDYPDLDDLRFHGGDSVYVPLTTFLALVEKSKSAIY